MGHRLSSHYPETVHRSARHRRAWSRRCPQRHRAADRGRRRCHPDRCRPWRGAAAASARVAWRGSSGADHPPPLRSHRDCMTSSCHHGCRDAAAHCACSGHRKPDASSRRCCIRSTTRTSNSASTKRATGRGNPSRPTDILAGPVCEGAGWRITAEVVDSGQQARLSGSSSPALGLSRLPVRVRRGRDRVQWRHRGLPWTAPSGGECRHPRCSAAISPAARSSHRRRGDWPTTHWPVPIPWDRSPPRRRSAHWC